MPRHEHDGGIAADSGADIAVESADVVLLRGQVSTVLDARKTSARAYQRTRGNPALTFAFNGGSGTVFVI
ncbi:hypothetical protein DMH04_34430 [Kibdelosporangium aridum]|uniref:Uncharacterized protein n=1 Tax=Kibdelosporangium aridum TaxID=2030 RepID=A0A428Z0P4_KIBAR|nr:hypothetical protein [Kibdelosporangium aridum]RSM77816.1 hypothetical protein DMH04_34430 [Kibdelosporangium aridum]